MALVSTLKGETTVSPIIIIDTAAGLEYMFIGHCIHWDISSGNILLHGEMAKMSWVH